MELINAVAPSQPFGLTAGLATGGAAMAAGGSSSMSSRFGTPADDLTPFEREKAAFRRKRPFLNQFTGKFVAIHNGQVAASGESMRVALGKFFSAHPAGTSVYVGFVGRTPVAHVSAPVFLRRR